MNLPTEFVTVESLGTVAGMAGAVLLFLVLLHLFEADQQTMMVLGFTVAAIPQLVIALSVLHPAPLSLVIAAFNSALSFLAAWFIYRKSIPLLEKMLDGHD